VSAAVVIGVGNADRGDDALGLEVTRRLRARPLGGAAVLDGDGDPAGILGAWAGRRLAVLVDASSGDDAPGTVRRFEAHRSPIPASLRHASTHSFGPAEAVELARALRQLPPEVIVFAVEGHRFAPGRGLSPAVEAAIPEVVERILDELRQRGAGDEEEHQSLTGSRR
jgi:hydrogenase maturation protease